jgi:DNA-binding transcriptional MerR regulator
MTAPTSSPTPAPDVRRRANEYYQAAAVERRPNVRLQLIAVLQDRGLQLSAIRDALSRVEKGQLWLEDWLGLSAELRTPWSEERPMLLSGQDLAERLGHRPGLVSALRDAGLLRRAPQQATSYLVPSPGLLDIALELEAAGVDIDLAAEAAATVRKQLRAASGELVKQVLDRAGTGFARTGSTADVTKAPGRAAAAGDPGGQSGLRSGDRAGTAPGRPHRQGVTPDATPAEHPHPRRDGKG